MKHYRNNRVSDADLYEVLDAYDYADFDDEYYYEMSRKKQDSKRKSQSRRKNTNYDDPFHDYIKGY